jgi:hypothetical protein
MSAKTIVHRSALFAAAAALSTAGLLVGPAAHADKYSCAVNGSPFQLRVHVPGRTYDVEVQAQGSKLSGDARAANTYFSLTSAAGSVSSGVIAGTAINFIVEWGQRWGGGATHFRGAVGSDGFAHGSATGSAAHATDDPSKIEFEPGEWDSINKLECPAAGNTDPKPADQKPSATVTSDVDVYNVKNEPDGTGHVVGTLRAGNKVQLLGTCKKESWCNVSGDAVPGGSGWVWGALDF